MSTVYAWDSTKKPQEVLESIHSLKKGRFKSFNCSHKRLNDFEIKFSIWHWNWFIRFPHYAPPILEGIIKDTPKGCEVTAEKRVVSAYIEKYIFDCLDSCVLHFWHSRISR